MNRGKQIFLGVAVVLPIIVVIAGIKFFQVKAAIAEHSNFQMPPEAVTSMKVKLQLWTQQLKVIGTLAPVQGATLGTEVIGRVSKINVESGRDVEKGTIIIELDSSVEQANLKEAQAKVERARKKVQRYEQLKSTKAISPENLDEVETEYRTSMASMQSLQSIIDRKNIVAPFSGRVGIREVNVGQIVIPGTAIIPLYSLDPLYVNFSVPQQFLPKMKVGGSVSITLDAFKDKKFIAVISAINPNVTESVRNVAIQATLSNGDMKFSPGMFVSVLVDLTQVDNLVVIPSSSISYAPFGDSVYVIEQVKGQDGKEFLGVRQQMVQLGETRGDLVQIISGLKEGEEIVTSGVFKLRPNAPVKVNNSIQPSALENPTPADT